MNGVWQTTIEQVSLALAPADESKQDEKVGAAATVGSNNYQFRLPNHCTVFTAELKALDLAIEHIRFSDKPKFVICTDSKSSLEALEGNSIVNPLVMKLREKIDEVQTEKTIKFVWIPSHIGIKGNEKADRLAKDSLGYEPMRMDVPHSDFKTQILPYIRKKWQAEWEEGNEVRRNKLYSIKQTIAPPQTLHLSRREEIVYRRLRIGHSYITHSFLLKREDKPKCYSCDCDFTVEHILLNCAEYTYKRINFYSAPDLKTLFDTVSPAKILSFVKDIELFYKI